MRWSLDGLAVPVFLVDEGVAPELEESFSLGHEAALGLRGPH